MNCCHLSSAFDNCEREKFRSRKTEKSRASKTLPKSQNSQAKILYEEDQHVYNNCFKLRARALKNSCYAEKDYEMELLRITVQFYSRSKLPNTVFQFCKLT